MGVWGPLLDVKCCCAVTKEAHRIDEALPLLGASKHGEAPRAPPVAAAGSTPAAPLAASPVPPQMLERFHPVPDPRECAHPDLASRKTFNSLNSYASGAFAGRSTMGPTERSGALAAARYRLVMNFASVAVDGRPCKLVNAELECVDAEYRLDSTLQHLVVAPTPDKDAAAGVQCNIGRIMDIHTYAEDGPCCFPPEVLGSVGDEQDLQKLMLITFLDWDGEPSTVSIVEASHEGRDAFLQTMRVLGQFAQQAAKLQGFEDKARK